MLDTTGELKVWGIHTLTEINDFYIIARLSEWTWFYCVLGY